eukprot:1388701-Amphidinium_carterae.1
MYLTQLQAREVPTSLSPFQEDEVLLPPCCQFRIAGIFDLGECTTIILEEVKSPHWILDLSLTCVRAEVVLPAVSKDACWMLHIKTLKLPGTPYADAQGYCVCTLPRTGFEWRTWTVKRGEDDACITWETKFALPGFMPGDTIEFCGCLEMGDKQSTRKSWKEALGQVGPDGFSGLLYPKDAASGKKMVFVQLDVALYLDLEVWLLPDSF